METILDEQPKPRRRAVAFLLTFLCFLAFGGICFLASCLFSDAKRSLGFGAGIPILMYVLKMLSNLGGNAENAKYFTFFTLFDPNGIVAGNSGAITGMIVLLIGAVILFTAGIAVFCRKDLNI